MSEVLTASTEKLLFKDTLYKVYDFLETSGLTEEHYRKK